jgi:hypothetical protein
MLMGSPTYLGLEKFFVMTAEPSISPRIGISRKDSIFSSKIIYFNKVLKVYQVATIINFSFGHHLIREFLGMSQII